MFQFTHPGRGATVRTSFHHLATRSFNSRTPGGVRRTLSLNLFLKHYCFNSRTPGGVRLGFAYVIPYANRFQFTHPGRGATTMGLFTLFEIRTFQFTHPGRGATS